MNILMNFRKRPAKRRLSRSALMCCALIGLLCLIASLRIVAAAEDDAKADRLFETAYSAYKMERWKDAAKKFYDFMASAPMDPRNAEAQYYVGRAYMHTNYLNKAIGEFTYLIKDFPKSQYAELGLHYRARCYLKTRKSKKAIKDMEKVVNRPVEHKWRWSKDAVQKQLNANHRKDVFWLAKHYMKKDEPRKAIATYQKLPNQMEAFRHVVNVYYKLGKFDKIKQVIDGLKEKHKHAAFKYMIEFYAKKKAYNHLKEIFAKLMRDKDPDKKTDELVWHTANSFEEFGENKWEMAMQMVSRHYDRLARKADYELAEYNYENMAYQDKLELFVIKYREGKDVNQVLRWKGITLEKHGKAEQARKEYRRIGNTAEGHWYVAESYHGEYARKKNREAAIKEYIKIRKRFYSQKWSAMAQWRVATLFRDMDEVDKAVKAYRHIAERWPKLKGQAKRINKGKVFFAPAALLGLADTLREAGRYKDAIMEYRILVQNYPKTREASRGAYRTGLCFEGLTKGETAVKVYKSVLRRYPKTAAASDAHTRLEAKYGIPDTEVSDSVDFFAEEEGSKKDYLDDPTKLKR